MMLTQNFSMEEFATSSTGERAGIDNSPPTDEIRMNILRTAQTLELLRTALGKPIIISSGYRCPALNKLVGGVPNSAHVQGLAADILSPQFGTPLQVSNAVNKYLQLWRIDQLIYEHSWTHIGLAAENPRHQVLTLMPGGGYAVGIIVR